MKKTKRSAEWAWSFGRTTKGPFATREEAIDNAKTYKDDYPSVRVGEVRYIAPVEFGGCVMLDRVIDDMETLAEFAMKLMPGSIEFGLQPHENEEHKQKIRHAASNALDLAIRKWAKKYVWSNSWVMEAGDTVVL